MRAPTLFWKCWRCGGQHPRFMQSCPDSGVNYEGATTKAERLARWEKFKARYLVGATSERREKLQRE